MSIADTRSTDAGQRVFVSYAREDKAYAKKLAEYLQNNGHTVWWDHMLIAGDDYRTKIIRQLDEANKVVVIWSSHSVQSPFVIDESQRANNASKLVPIIIDVSQPPMGFGHLHAINANDLESEFPAILAAVENRLPPTRDQDRRHIKKLRIWLGALMVVLATFLTIGAAYYFFTNTTQPDLTAGLNPALNYHIYNSEKLGIRMIYPKSRLMVDTTEEDKGRIPLHTAHRKQEVLVTRTPLPDHNNPRIGRRIEWERLKEDGYEINYAGPSNPSNWRNWYILSGAKPDGEEFYYRRWYTQKDVVSIEFEYERSLMGIYDDAIGAMTLKGRFQFSER